MDELGLERNLRSSAPDIEPAPAAAYHSFMQATSITLGSNGSPCPYIGNMFSGPSVSPFRAPEVPMRPFWPTTPENYGRYGLPQGLYPFYPSFSPNSPSNDTNPYVSRLGSVPAPFPPLLNSYKDSSYFPSPYRLSSPLIHTPHSSFNLISPSSKSFIEEDKSKPDDLLNYELTKPSHISCSKPESQVKRLSDKSKEFGKVKSKSSEKLPTVIFCGTKECIECDDTRGSIDYSKTSKAFTTFRHHTSNVASSHKNISENISSLANPPSNVISTMPVKVCVTTPALRASPIVSPSQNVSSHQENKLAKAEKYYASTSSSPYNEEMPNLESYHSRCTMVTPYSATPRNLKSTKNEKKKKEVALNKINNSSVKTQPENLFFPLSSEKVEVQALNLSIQENTSELKPINRNETIGVCYPTTKLSSQSSCNQTGSVHSQISKNSNSCHVSKPLVNNSKSSLKSFTESSLSKISIENRKSTKGSGEVSGTIPVGIAIAHQRSQQCETAPQLKPIKADKTSNTSNLDPIVPSKILDSLNDKDLKKVENLSKVVTESNLSTNVWNPEIIPRNSFPPQPWITSGPLITPTFWLNQANDLTAGFQLARDPLTGHLYLIPNPSSLEVTTEHSNNVYPTLLSVPNSAPIPQLLNQPQIVSQQIVNQEHLSTGPSISLQPQVQEKPFEIPTQTSENSGSAISLAPTQQPFAYTAFPTAPTISYFFESSSVVQLPPNNNSVGTDSGKRSQGTSPLHPCSSPHSSSEDTLIEGETDDNLNVTEVTQVKVNNHSISTAIQVDMSSDDDFEEKPVQLFDSGIQTDSILEFSKDSSETNKESESIETNSISKLTETPTKPTENELDIVPPVLIAESQPVMDFIDYHGLNLLVDSIEEFASREQSNLGDDISANQKEISQAEIQSSMTDGLGLLCALAEQRFKEENENCNIISQKSKLSTSKMKLNFLNLQNKYKDRNKKISYYKNKTKKKGMYIGNKYKNKQIKKKYVENKHSAFDHTMKEESKIDTFSKEVSDEAETPSKKLKTGDTKHETSLYDELWFIRRSERIFLHDAGVGTATTPKEKIKRSNEKLVKSKSDSKKLKHKTSRKQKKYSKKQKMLNYETKRIGSDVDSEDLPLSKYATPAVRSCVLVASDLEEKIRVILMEDDLLYAGYVTAIRAPDVYGVVLDGERASRPHIFSREELLNEAIVEVKPTCPRQLPEGTRLCAYWSQQYRCLYPGTVAKAPATSSVTVQSNKPLIYVEFDDGDSGRIPLEDIRMLPADFPIVSGEDSLNQSNNTKVDSPLEDSPFENVPSLKSFEMMPKHEETTPNHKTIETNSQEVQKTKNDHTLKPKKHKKHKEEHKHRHHHKKHKKERTPSCSTPVYTCVLSPSSISSTGSDRKKSDLTVKITSTLSPSENGNIMASEEEDTLTKKNKKNKKLPSVGKSKIAAFLPVNQLWCWHGKSFRRVGAKGKAKKDLYKSIIREKEIISIGDCAVFISTGRPHLPYVGRIIMLWQAWGGNMMVRVNWFYHPEETKKTKKIKNTEGALFESPHMDENDVQTISHKCEVLKWGEYEARQKIHTLDDNNDVYYLAGLYDPINNHMTLEPGVT